MSKYFRQILNGRKIQITQILFVLQLEHGGVDFIQVGIKEPKHIFVQVFQPGQELFMVYDWNPNKLLDKIIFNEYGETVYVGLAYEDFVDVSGTDQCERDEDYSKDCSE